MGPIHSLSDEDWNKTFSVNTTGFSICPER